MRDGGPATNAMSASVFGRFNEALCDAALLYYGAGSELWLRQKLRGNAPVKPVEYMVEVARSTVEVATRAGMTDERT